jgi:hypothetical protein
VIQEKIPETIWVVVEVNSGIPVMAEAYYGVESAVMREQYLRKHMRPEYDEVGVFEVRVRHSIDYENRLI